MKIHWFPGHMTKALRMMQAEMDLVDVIFYILDARAPHSSVNMELHKVAGSRPIIYVLNKADLAAPQKNTQFIKEFEAQGYKCLAVESTKSGTAKQIIQIALNLLSEKLARFKARGIDKPLRAMVVGIPNCGKSSFINNMAGRAKALAANRPGVTKGKQWVRVNPHLELLDTPGTLWPKLEDQNIAHNLAFIGSINDDVVDQHELSLELIKKLKTAAPESIKVRYKIEAPADSPEELLAQIAVARGYRKSAAEPDFERAASALIDDFRKGRLGRITLD